MKRIIAFCLVLIFVFCLILPSVSYADPMSAATIGAMAFTMMKQWGISTTAASATGLGMQNWMTSEIETYVNRRGGTLIDAFGSETARIVAGKLIIGQQLYNGIKNFVDWLIDEFGISDEDIELNEGLYNNTRMGTYVMTEEWSGDGVGCYHQEYKRPTSSDPYGGYMSVHIMNGTQEVTQRYASQHHAYRDEYGVMYNEANRTVLVSIQHFNRINNENDADPTLITIVRNVDLDNNLKWNGADYVEPTVLNPDKEWSGTIGGQDWPDTNLEDLVDSIYEDVGLNDLQVDGEVIDVPVPPEPTPAPIDPDTSLQDVPWEGLNDLINNTGKDITDSIEDAASDITGSLDGLRDETAEGVQDITGAIEGVQEGVSDLTDTITEALTAPEIDEKTFDLSELFPFCIPFDIYHLLQKFDGSPAAPHVQLPIVIPSIGFSYTLDLDFSAWDTVAAAMRTVELIVYALGLAWATSKVIKW